jgi:hypothetical protein
MKMLFLKRLVEEAAYAFVGAAAVALGSGDLGHAALTGAGVAGVRAVIGVLVKNFGDKDKPAVQ